MTPEELAVILESHKKWLSGAGGERADLQRANLTGADLREADLRGANLHGANLHGADLDFSCLPLWCGSLGIKVDERLFSQFAYHLCRMDVPTDMVQYQDALRDIACKFHRFDECRGFPEKKGDE
jgi:uncharacterized protein YjbI with pentapeptide repeats